MVFRFGVNNWGYSYLNEDKKKVYSHHSHNLYIDYKF
ncbi:Uncharacterised protein [Streptococcus pneumoniae]|nr:Uncharacterised protein [Streptococcus pneumoniae]VJD33546.1 Uncharacterised protein [Streptococcus pneumoniae]VJD48509.1 Uncharacterised protein [Streptococcus pneumoniae]VJD50886.1 Uncharacterised protein [Streptococcus pneumoniae]VJD81475.1 Uncharacterised protein [Streptococcus pneumoniae]